MPETQLVVAIEREKSKTETEYLVYDLYDLICLGQHNGIDEFGSLIAGIQALSQCLIQTLPF